ncbi:hypothetical protein [Nocardioides convexus]|nr:hypothetical protein [Nocardioides convexus]
MRTPPALHERPRPAEQITRNLAESPAGACGSCRPASRSSPASC